MNTDPQDAVNKVWGDFWTREKKTFLDWEASRIRKTEAERAQIARDFFNHKVFHVGYPVFKKYVPSEPGCRILDVGTGSGRYGLKVAMDFPESVVVMTDVVPEALSYVEAAAKKLGLTNTEMRREDSRALSFSDGSFDVVMCDAVIQYIPEYRKCVAEMARVLKPGGRLIISTVNTWNVPHTLHKWWMGTRYPHGWEKSFTHGELATMFKENGVRVIAKDGYYFAYGVYRLGYQYPLLKWVARVMNRATKFFDAVLGRVIDRNLGFQIIVVGDKSEVKTS